MPHHDRPNWEDVRWDHGAASEAIGALRRAAAEIDRALADEALHVEIAVAEWRGESRSQLDRRRAELRAELRSLAAACRGAAEQVRSASERATAEQRRREREREEWERTEREREERRRRDHVA